MSEPGRDRLLTDADYAALPDDGHRYQLLEGQLVMTPSPDAWHQDVSRELEFRLLAWVREQGSYARFGVTHYWIVDLAARTIEEYAPSGDVYRVRGIAGYDEPFRPEAIPGFAFKLSVVALPEGP